MISSTVFNPRSKKISSPRLSLVALMDIFTILVFFLLLNSGEAQKIENAKFVTLPNSTKGETPHEELMILVNSEELWVGKEKIADIQDLELDPEAIIEPLQEALQDHRSKLTDITPFQEKNGLAVIIMGDKRVPYVLLKSVMATCRVEEYLNISLAVNRIVDSRSLPTSGTESSEGEAPAAEEGTAPATEAAPAPAAPAQPPAEGA